MSAGKGFLLLAMASLPFCAWSDESRIDNIRQAASEARAMTEAKGIAGAHDMVLSCYQRSKTYETCVAQDFIVSNVAARGSRDPLGVLEEMAERITQALQRSEVPLADAQAYILLVKEHGFPAYLERQ